MPRRRPRKHTTQHTGRVRVFRAPDGRRYTRFRPECQTMELAIENAKVIALFNESAALQQWLRPGFLSFLMGQYVAALEPHALRIERERNAMLDEAAMKYADTNADGTPHPRAGQHVTEQRGAATITLYRSKEAGEDFRRREAELYAGRSIIHVERKITIADIEKIERERLSHPRVDPTNPAASTEFAVNFAALMPIIDASTGPGASANGQPNHATNGVVAPDIPRAVGSAAPVA